MPGIGPRDAMLHFSASMQHLSRAFVSSNEIAGRIARQFGALGVAFAPRPGERITLFGVRLRVHSVDCACNLVFVYGFGDVVAFPVSFELLARRAR